MALMTIMPPASISWPITLPRRPERSPVISPTFSDGTVISMLTIGSSSEGFALLIASAKAYLPAVLKAISFEWHTEKYSMGHGNYLESKTCPETRKHPHKDHQVNCHYEVRYMPTYRSKDGKATAHPEYYQGDLSAAFSMASSSGGNGGPVSEMTIRKNAAMNGIEILFPAKPERNVIDTLKSYGFRWSQRQGLWWKRYSDSLLSSLKTTFPMAKVEGFDHDLNTCNCPEHTEVAPSAMAQ